MRKLFTLIFYILLISKAFGQIEKKGIAPISPIIYFNYDSAGNQIQRYYCSHAGSCVIPPLPSQINDETNEFESFKQTDKDEIMNYFNVYPNPTTGKINISWTEDVKNLIQKIEIVGYSSPFYKELKFSAADYFTESDISFESIGIYIIKFHFANEKYESIQIIKE